VNGKLTINRQQVIIHLTIWALILLFPYLSSSGIKGPGPVIDLRHAWYPVFQAALLFYLNYFVLVDRFLVRRKYVAYLGLNLLLVVAFRFDWLLLGAQGVKPAHGPDPNGIDRFETPHYSLQYLFTLFVPALLAVLIKKNQQNSREEADKKDRENKHLQAELQHLKYQLQPHFFFNSLNNIYALTVISPERAQDTIHKLGKLMRYLLYDTNRERVMLSEEITFMEKYIQLMEIRQAARVKTTYTFPHPLPQDFPIAPLLFVPLIENAFKHGVSVSRESPISVNMQLNGKELLFTTSNHNYPQIRRPADSSGIGLDNLKKRLELIYPDRHTFTSIVEENFFLVRLQINLEE